MQLITPEKNREKTYKHTLATTRENISSGTFYDFTTTLFIHYSLFLLNV